MPTITIGNRKIGDEQPCFIIAEAGVNHNGSLELAKRLIDAAAGAGADAVKFQIIKAEGLYVKDAGKFTTDFGEKHDIYEIWKKTEVPDWWVPELVTYCTTKGIIFFSSVFDEKTAGFLEPFVPVYKIASSETTHLSLLKQVAKSGKPIIFSIGGAELQEVEEALKAIISEGNKSIAIMQCVAQYPTPLEAANVKAIKTLAKEFPEVVVGYSDHSMDPAKVPVAAVVYGAKLIEKHFTLSRALPGIDHKMSLEPAELKAMVMGIRSAEGKIRAGKSVRIDPILEGDGAVTLTGGQKDLLAFVRRKIFAMKEIKAGEAFTRENIAVLRPGNRKSSGGLHPRDYFNLLTKKASRTILPQELITSEHIGQ